MVQQRDYETQEKELKKLHIQHENEKKRHEPINKGGRANVFKKKYS